MFVLKEFTFIQQSAPATPAAGFSVLYTKTDGKWYIKNSDGIETEITNVAAGASNPPALKVYMSTHFN